MVLHSLQHLKKHYSQYLQLVVFMTLCLSLNTLPGLAVFLVQLFPVDYTKCVRVWLEYSAGKVESSSVAKTRYHSFLQAESQILLM